MTPKTKAVLCTVGRMAGWSMFWGLCFWGGRLMHDIYPPTTSREMALIISIVLIISSVFFIHWKIKNTYQHCKKKHGVE